MRSSPSSPDRLVSVGVPVPGLGLLTYRVPDDAPVPPKGARVIVPLGARRVTGCVVATDPQPPQGAQLRNVSGVIDVDPFLPPAVVDLALWVGEYYASGPGDALAMALPPTARGERANAFRTARRVRLTAAAEAAPDLKGAKQRAAIDALRDSPAGLLTSELGARGVSSDTLAGLATRGLVAITAEVALRDPFVASAAGGETPRWALPQEANGDRGLMDEQAAALHQLERAADAGAFSVTLLHGVTGSGKTEIYLRLARHVIAAGKRAIVLVPEIALTPAAAGLFRARFGDRVAIQHSGLSTGERHDQWHRIRQGAVDVVVGTRSAVFAPVDRLGLIVVDEEHDGSYKQEEAPRYHGRDVAIVRARAEGALAVLGSATPSLESAANARSGRYRSIVLTKRVLDRPLAAVRVVDMRQEYAAHGANVTIGGVLADAIRARLDRGEQTVVLLNRRGFATVIFCRQCGSMLECPHCSVTLTLHRAARRVRCHYCDYSAAVPGRCGACGGEFLEHAGVGTERIEADLRVLFPEARVVRVDRDTIRRRGAIANVLAAVARGEIDILVGTQMVAKGHDFPAVTLVGVVSADGALGLADFRASERTFQLITQVVGRAGRGTTPGEAIVQSIHPDHYSIQTAAAQDYAAFYEREMDFRRKLDYPPVVSLINLVVRDRSLERAMTDAKDLASRVRKYRPGGRVLGPAPAALSKVKDEYRAQLLVKSAHRTAMRQAVVRALAERPDLKRRVIVDVDPMTIV